MWDNPKSETAKAAYSKKISKILKRMALFPIQKLPEMSHPTFSFSQAEFFYDDTESDYREWLWHMKFFYPEDFQKKEKLFTSLSPEEYEKAPVPSKEEQPSKK